MKTGSKLLAIIVATAFATSAFSPPASAFVGWGGGHCWWCHPKVKKAPPKAHSSGSVGKLVVGCIMGSALGLILASSAKGGGLKWMSQKEWEDLKVKVPNPLTNEEAATIAFTCGLGAIPVMASWRQQAPAPATSVVRVKG